ncbi:MAG TPA: phosphatidylglycerol lysyltransferase domain-containing protein [Candidatus Paceibacterota bacterium]|nr:phosphatidylglycerol lysyltransferase domain-containing protein [Candidatus Paceibacterota bacterium]
MIPQFPEFKKVELSDRTAVESHTHPFEPYSDFNFTSLYAWDTSEERMISELHGNLVVRFTDYTTHEPFFSFLGTSEVEQTARTLIEQGKAEGIDATLKLVPEVVAQSMNVASLQVEEDRDNFDYLYAVSDLAAMKGGAYIERRGAANKFANAHPDARLESIDLSNQVAQEKIFAVLEKWESNKKTAKKDYELEHERQAIHRLCQTAAGHDLIAMALFSDDDMLAFRIEEILPNQYSMGHFFKADTSHKEIYAFFIKKMAEHMETLGVAQCNFEQDLGVPGLRSWKMSYKPSGFLRKYRVSLK